MSYIFKGTLCGFICSECPEPLSQLTVRLYRVNARDERLVAAAVANPKDTFAILSESDAAAKSSRLLAEAVMDDAGNFHFALGEKDKYQGEAFEVDVYCPTVPHRKPTPTPPKPLQFTITTLQPQWRRAGDGFAAAWEYCIPHRFWCGVRARFGAWTICGHVTHCETGNPIGGVRVRAFDTDWLQDDALGSGVTDGTGRFRIDYLAEDFKPTVFPGISLELFGGPDLYFRVETLAGVVLLAEPRSRGRQSDRENVGPCFCVDLCLKDQPPTPEPLPVFTALGAYQYVTDINSTPAGNGLTVGGNRAFFSTVRLNGVLPKTLQGSPLEYRFEVQQVGPAGPMPGAWTPVVPGLIDRTVIGLWQRYAPAFPGDPNPVKTKLYTVNGTAGPNELVATIMPDGWVRVPQESNVFGVEGFFQPNGNMIQLRTPALASYGAISLTGVSAGQSSTSNGQPLAQDRHFAIRMRVRKVGVPASEADAGICQHVAINNTLYNNINHHPSWAGWTQSGALGVAMVDILQLQGGGCTPITTALDILVTLTHPHLGPSSVTLTGPGGPYAFTLPPAVPGEIFGTAVPPGGFSVAALPSCAYLVTLSTTLLLTTGDGEPGPLIDQIAFCKH